MTVAQAGHDRGARAAFPAYLDSPNECQYQYFSDGEPSAEYFFCGVLRLYPHHPPSLRLARAMPLQFPGTPIGGSASDEVANLEALHKDVLTWKQ